jgi:N-acetylneuraminate synthase
MLKNFKIGKRFVGPNYKPLIIVELGINHNGSLIAAKKLVDAAHKAGAEIIKHQTHICYDEMSEEAKKIIPSHTKENIYEIIKKCSLDEIQEFELMNYVKKKGMIFISTPFSRKAVDRLVKFKIPAFKIGSGECNNYPLIEYIAKQKKPVILSTGMNTVESIKPSVKIFKKYKIPYALLHCTNVYPTPADQIRINAIEVLKKNFPDAVLGLSDHSDSIYPSLGSIALGASILEKHFVISKISNKGPDVSASMDPKELKELIGGSNRIFLSMGSYKGPIKLEKSTMKFAFASIVATKKIRKGEILTKKNIFPRRPGTGDFLAVDYNKVLGKKTKVDIKENTLIRKKDLKN